MNAVEMLSSIVKKRPLSLQTTEDALHPCSVMSIIPLANEIAHHDMAFA
jgi:hypothetical protein